MKTLTPEEITELWSTAIKEAFIQQRSEPHIFAELLIEKMYKLDAHEILHRKLTPWGSG